MGRTTRIETPSRSRWFHRSNPCRSFARNLRWARLNLRSPGEAWWISLRSPAAGSFTEVSLSFSAMKLRMRVVITTILQCPDRFFVRISSGDLSGGHCRCHRLSSTRPMRDCEGNPQNRRFTQYPTLRSGQAISADGRRSSILSSYDAATGTRSPFAGGVIPANRIDPIASKYLELYEPQPNLSPRGFSNYLDATPNQNDDDSGSIRLDHQFRSNHSLFGRYTINDNRARLAGNFPERATSEVLRAQQIALGHTLAGLRG